ncbi:hypothetical protein K503DRAFT_804955 [Rhizopogon vinicolor AM-OR11-026]|uniref:Uncharacterized protein n=1 Tax=Rhizopogon vinicolor AM-OR11-026 TaxID=1314800 RepID=A0A1B7MJI7_9AGAM|nr:hypothetical protein K503DRAFT_804955 [Rhizopogon vinicolor AM-OR11-026]
MTFHEADEKYFAIKALTWHATEMAERGIVLCELPTIELATAITPPASDFDPVKSGKVRYIGASSMRCWQFAMLKWALRMAGRSSHMESTEKNPFKKMLDGGDTAIINCVEELAKKEELQDEPDCRLQESIVKGIALTPEGMAYLEEPYGSKAVRSHPYMPAASRKQSPLKSVPFTASIDLALNQAPTASRKIMRNTFLYTLV